MESHCPTRATNLQTFWFGFIQHHCAWKMDEPGSGKYIFLLTEDRHEGFLSVWRLLKAQRAGHSTQQNITTLNIIHAVLPQTQAKDVAHPPQALLSWLRTGPQYYM